MILDELKSLYQKEIDGIEFIKNTEEFDLELLCDDNSEDDHSEKYNISSRETSN